VECSNTVRDPAGAGDLAAGLAVWMRLRGVAIALISAVVLWALAIMAMLLVVEEIGRYAAP